MKENLSEGALQFGTKVAVVTVGVQALLWPIPLIAPGLGSAFVSALTSSGFIAYMSFDGWRRNRKIKKTNPTS